MRGLALLLIFVEHLADLSYVSGALTPGMGRLPTLTNLTWTAQAEFFVFFSGYVFGLVYAPTVRRHGLWLAEARALHRVWQLYRTNLLLLCLIVPMPLLAGAGAAGLTTAADLGYIQTAPMQALTSFLQLRYGPAFIDILMLYMVLIAVAPFFLALILRSPAVAIALSGALYCVAQLAPQLSIRFDGMQMVRWFFNPLAYQFLFAIAMALGVNHSLGNLKLRKRSVWVWASIALVVVLSSIKLLAGWAARDRFGLAAYAGYFDLPGFDRSTLAPFRLAHFFVLLYLALVFIPNSERLGGSWLARSIVQCGKYSLQIFSVGIVLTYLGVVFLFRVNGGTVAYFTASLAGVLLLLFAAHAIHWIEREPWKAARPSRVAKPAAEENQALAPALSGAVAD